MIAYVVLVPLGYLLGSVPFGLIAGRVFGGVDVREHGSGNTGMTNVLRTVGVRVAALVLALDMGKAVAAVALARAFGDSPGVEAATAVAVVVGHNWPVFVGFKGGRGAAAGWGGLIMLSPISGLVATAIGLPIIAAWRYVSLASVLAASSGATTLVVLSIIGVEPLPYAWYGAIVAPLIVVRHKGNIKRLLRGEERKLGQPAGQTKPSGKNERSRDVRWPRSVL